MNQKTHTFKEYLDSKYEDYAVVGGLGDEPDPEEWLASLDIDSIIQYADENAIALVKELAPKDTKIAWPFKKGLHWELKFEDFLKEEHAEDYHGTDDDMPDAFDIWLERMPTEELIGFGEKYGQLVTEMIMKEQDERKA